MGLDASVRCRCFEEHKLNPGPVPYEDLYIDDEGYLSSKTLDEARSRFDYRRFDARYGELEDAFRDWLDEGACEHPYGDYHSDRVANWAGVCQFEDLVEECGGEEAFPLLSKMLPHANGGSYPVELVEPTLAELDRFIELVCGVKMWALCISGTDEIVWESTDSGGFIWIYTPSQRIGMDGGKVFFAGPDDSFIETVHFRQEPTGIPSGNNSQYMRIVCLDQDAETMVSGSIDSEGHPNEACEFYIKEVEAPFLYEGKYWTAERIRGLLLASLETGNPIRWE